MTFRSKSQNIIVKKYYSEHRLKISDAYGNWKCIKQRYHQLYNEVYSNVIASVFFLASEPF